MLDINSIYHGDCLEIMNEIDDKSIDMILCDLPYGTTQNKWDSVIDLTILWNQYKRIIRDNRAIVLTSQTPFDKKLAMSNISDLKYEWIWIKEQGTGHLNANIMPLKIHENILIFCNGKPLYNPQKNPCKARKICRSGLVSKSTNYGKHIQMPESIYNERYPITTLYFNHDKPFLHPTQKPVALFEYLIKTYTNEGDLVLDNCIGSGTTAIAALNTKRNFVGIEKELEYVEITRKRIASLPIPLDKFTL